MERPRGGPDRPRAGRRRQRDLFPGTTQSADGVSAQAGTAELQLVPEESVGVPQLTTRVSLAVSSPLVIGCTYRFEAVKTENPAPD